MKCMADLEKKNQIAPQAGQNPEQGVARCANFCLDSGMGYNKMA